MAEQLSCMAKAQDISLERFRGYQLIRQNYEIFPPRMICNTYALNEVEEIYVY